ncbi:MAG: T9SS type A sorting domain-containing protein [Bacteroidia bacterium]|nr:T9SS type A sorting domain-containing protein [Bacteroidia bacterium]
MKIITTNSMKQLLIICALFIGSFAKAQLGFSVTPGTSTICAVGGTNSSASNIVSCVLTNTVSGATYYTFTFSPNCPIYNISWTGNTANVTMSAPSAGVYTVVGLAYASTSSSVVLSSSTQTILALAGPTVSVSGPANVCPNSVNNYTASGASSYVWNGNTGSTTYSLSGAVASMSAGTVGSFVVVATGANGCSNNTSVIPFVGTASVTVSNGTICSGGTINMTASGAITYTWFPGNMPFPNVTVSPTVTTVYTLAATNGSCTSTSTHVIVVNASPNLTISGTSTVCAGSSAVFTVSGASTYIWSNGSVGSTLNVLPNTSTNYTVLGQNTSSGCNGTAIISVIVNTACAMVWPGDANRDGQVDNTDVLELGLAASSTGPARTSTSNAWAAQFANAWTGTISTGWNKCHADCNGDGVVNSNDNVAISANFSLTHTFKGSAAAGTDIQIVASGVANAGRWNVADIVLGSSTSPLSQLYGVAFDLNFDQAMIQSDSIKVVYTSSFLNPSSSNINFQKAYFNNGKSYCATVRTNNTNVNGTGKIGEIWYKVKTGLPANSSISLSAGNAKMISAGGVLNNLGAASPVTLNIDNNPSGLNTLALLNNALRFYPNPASTSVKLENDLSGNTAFGIYDISGRLILAGEFTGSKTIDISKLEAGTYLIEFTSVNGKVSKKLVVE